MGLAYDAARGEIVLFGGIGATGFLGDTWTWDGTSWTEQHPGTSPSPRCCGGMAYDAARNVVVLFGGGDGSGSMNDTWTWDGSTWTEQHPSRSPLPRSSFGMAFHARTRKMVIFGGFGGGLDPTWTWDGTTWTKESPLHSPPFVYGPGMSEYRGDVLMFGGEWDCFDDVCWVRGTWLWDGSDWTHPSHGPGHPPGSRSFMGLTSDHARGQVVLNGGERNFSQLGDTWMWDGSIWTRLGPRRSPPRRWSMGMAYDAATQMVLLFGGAYYDENGEYQLRGDTWIWDGRTWLRVA